MMTIQLNSNSRTKNVAFLDYMTMAVLPKHLLEGEDMQTSDFFRNPVGTGPYKIESWDEGQAITLVKNEDYFKGELLSIKLYLRSYRMTMQKRFS